MAGENVPEHVLVVFTQLLHLIYLFLRLNAPQEVKTSGILKLGATERERIALVRKRFKSSTKPIKKKVSQKKYLIKFINTRQINTNHTLSKHNPATGKGRQTNTLATR